jgi:hypothetical protein
MAAAAVIPLRFQRQELQGKGALSNAGLACLAWVPGPQELLAALTQMNAHRDAMAALALMLPRRQAVWWACLAVRLLPDLTQRPAEQVAVEAAETWVQNQRMEECERALTASELCPIGAPATYAALAAYWCGPSLAPRGQQVVAPAPYLPGVAVRSALLLLLGDPALEGRISAADLLAIGWALMHGDSGRQAQAAVRGRLSPGQE